MCGIFGQITTNPEKINDGYIKILGMDNVSRGKDSCGIFLDGEIYTGVYVESDFNKFIKGRRFKPSTYPVVFGHTRKASSGSVTRENAHPFGFEELENGDYRFIGVHNGTIYNDEELAEEFKISTKIKEPLNGGKSFYHRNKIDSQILLEILTKNTPNRDFSVLEKYEGGAALAWYDTLEPNVFYLFHGKSLNAYNYSQAERPLFAYHDGESLYFSSLEEPLEKIGATSKEIIDLDLNVVYRITDGDIENAERFEIDRSRLTYGRKPKKHSGYNFSRSSKSFKKTETPKALPLKVKAWNPFTINPIFKSINDFEGRVYELGLRYWKNGHLISGVYINIPEYGLLNLIEKSEGPTTYIEIMNRRKKFQNKVFDIESATFLDQTVITDKDTQILPFTDTIPTTLYIIEGIELLSLSDYNAVINNEGRFKNGASLDAVSLSHVSKFPVCNIKSLSSRKKDSATSILFYKNGNLANLTNVIPTLSGYRYSFKEGVCTDIVKRDLDHLKFIHNLKAYSTLKEELVEEAEVIEEPEIIDNKYGLENLLSTDYNQSEMVLCRSNLQNDQILKQAFKTVKTYDKMEEDNLDIVDIYFEAANQFIEIEEIANNILNDIKVIKEDNDEINNIKKTANEILKIVQLNIK